MENKCPDCSISEFEAIYEISVNSNFKSIFIRYTSCKSVDGVTDHFNVGVLVKKPASELKIDFYK